MQRRKYNLFHQIMAVVLCLAMLVPASVPLASATESTADVPMVSAVESTVSATSTSAPLATVFAGSDFQGKDADGNPSVSVGEDTLEAIINAMQHAGYTTVDGALICGDYTAASSTATDNAAQANAGAAAVLSMLKSKWTSLTDDSIVMVQGNHDPATTTGLDKAGAADAEQYGVYVLNEDTFPYKSAENDPNGTTALATSQALDAYLSQKVAQKYSKPIFIASHVPLHFCYRTINNGDNMYAKYIFDVLNKYGEELNIIFLFGHNHSQSYDDYLGGSAIFLPVGDSILVPNTGSSTKYDEYELNFTYMNAGYLGYTRTNCETKLSSTIFTIYEDKVTVKRYGYNSGSVALANMKDAGILDTATADKKDNLWDAVANTTVYDSPQTIRLKNFDVTLELGDLTSGMLDVGESATISVIGEYDHTYKVTWTSGNVQAASVSASATSSMSATVHGVGQGSAVITAVVTDVDTGETSTLSFTLTVAKKVASDPVTLYQKGKSYTFFQKTDKINVGSTYLIVDIEKEGSTVGTQLVLHYNANTDPRNEGDTTSQDSRTSSTTSEKRELNATSAEVFKIPYGNTTLTLADCDNENAWWQFVANGTYYNLRTYVTSNRDYTYLSLSETTSDFNTNDEDHDGILMAGTASTAARFCWTYHSTYGLLSRRTSNGFRYAMYYDQEQTDFSVYRIAHDGTSNDDSGSQHKEGDKLLNEEATSKTYLFEQTTVKMQENITAYLSDTTGYVNKDVDSTARTGDAIVLDYGTSQRVRIDVRVDMLSGTFDLSTPGEYPNLKVQYGFDSEGNEITICENYTLVVQDSVTLLKNGSKRGRMDIIYTLVDELLPGKQYMIVDSNAEGISHALGIYSHKVVAYNVLVQSLPVKGQNVLYINSTIYGDADQSTASHIGRKLTSQGSVNATLIDYNPSKDEGTITQDQLDKVTNVFEAVNVMSSDYKKAVRLVWTPTQRIYTTDREPVYVDSFNSGWFFLKSALDDRYLRIDADAPDTQLVTAQKPLTTNNETKGVVDRWWYQWRYSSETGLRVNGTENNNAYLFYNFQNHIGDSENMVEDSAAEKNFQTLTKDSADQGVRRVWLYERVTNIDVISARVSDLMGSVVEDRNASAFTGDYIFVDTTFADGLVSTTQVPLTTSMLSGTYNLNTPGTYDNLTITYQGTVISQNYSLTVTKQAENDYPDFPEEGAVRIDKTLDTDVYDYFSTGAAAIDLSVSGIPSQSGVDVVIMLDASSSMTQCVHGVSNGLVCKHDKDAAVGTTGGCPSRMIVLETALENMLAALKTPIDGYTPDIDIAIATFNGYTPINTDFELNWQADDMIGATNNQLYHDDLQQTLENRYDDSRILLDFTGIEKVDADVLNKTKGDFNEAVDIPSNNGTNFDRAMELSYDLLKAKQDQNALNGETRQSIVVFMSDGAPYQYNYFGGDGNLDAWDEYLLGLLDEIEAGQNVGDKNEDSREVTLSEYIPTDAVVRAAYDVYYNKNGDHWMAEAIKGNPNTKYKIIDPDATTKNHVVRVNGLGATMYTIGFGLESSAETTDNCVEVDDCTQVMINMATSAEHYFAADSSDELEFAFSHIASVLHNAGDAVFTDQMGPMFDLITSNYPTRYINADGTIKAGAVKYGPAPSITVKSYPTYRRSEIGQTLTFTADDGSKTTVVVTEDMIGTRKPMAPTVIETVTFNDNGTAAYSTAVGGGTTNILSSDGVICAATFWYNTDINNTKQITLRTGDTVTLQTECFYWNVGDIPQDELVLSYNVYLTGSMEGVRGEGNYDTNTHAELTYTNYLDHACVQSVPSPKLPWEQATVGYGFYLVDAKGNPIINQTTGETGSFEHAIKLTQPIYESFLLNDQGKAVGSIVASDLATSPVLKGYDLFDEGAEYEVTLNSDGSGSYTITVTTAAGVKLTTYVVGVADTAVTGSGTTETSNFATVNTVVWFAVTAQVGCVPDTVVIDYGLSVDMDVMSNDIMFGNYGSLAYIGKANAFPGYEAAKEENDDLKLWEYLQTVVDETAAFTTTTTTGTYGSAQLMNGEVRYTLNESNGMQMKEEEVFVYAVKFDGAVDPGYYYSTVTVIPATTIYYEDNFVNYKTYQYITDTVYSKDDENYRGTSAGDPLANNLWVPVVDEELDKTQAEDRPGSFSLSTIDANNIYGYDGAYTNMSRYSLGAAMKFTASYKENTAEGMEGTYTRTYGTAEFTFNGTGFDVISVTSGQTGTITVEVNGSYIDDTGATVPVQKRSVVDTFYGYKYVDSDNDGDSEWVPSQNTGTTDGTVGTNALYQVPVMKVDGLNYGTYTATITVSYNDFFSHGQYGTDKQYDFFLDAIRIYDPANDGKNNDVIEDAYIADGEGWPEYFELRNLIIKRDSLDLENGDETVHEGVIFIDNTGTTAEYDVANYKNFGPNNELYLAPGQAIAFKLDVPDPSDTVKVASIQLALKSVGGTAKVKVYDMADESAASVLPTGSISTATDLYYKITNLNHKNVVIVNTGTTTDAIVSITNVKVTYTGQHTDSIQDGFFTTTATQAKFAARAVQKLMCGSEGEQDPGEVVNGTIDISGATLSFEDEILTNLYFTVSGIEPLEMGLLTWSSEPADGTVDNAEKMFVGAIAQPELNRYMVSTDGIAAKNLGDEIYMRVYAKTADGVVYSDMISYSPKQYAMSRLENSENEDMKALCVAMLNYGAAAQEYFGYKTDDLMNADLIAEQKALVGAYSADLFTGAVAADPGKVGSFAATDGFSGKGATVSFDGAFAINYYFLPSAEVAGDLQLFIWTPETYAAVSQLTAENASEVISMTAQESGTYWGQMEGIAAKMLDKTYYVAGVYTDAEGNTHCTGVIAYSLSRYCMNNANSNMGALAQATAMYGYHAAQYFASVGG